MSNLFKKSKKYDVFKNMTEDIYTTKLQQIIDYHNIEITNLNNIIYNLETSNEKLKKDIYILQNNLPNKYECCYMEPLFIDNFMNKLKSVLSNFTMENDFLDIIYDSNAIMSGKIINDILLAKQNIDNINIDIYIADTNYINIYNTNNPNNMNNTNNTIDIEFWLHDICDDLYVENMTILIGPLYKFNQIIKHFSNHNKTFIINLFIIDTHNILNYINHILHFPIFIDGKTIKFIKNISYNKN